MGLASLNYLKGAVSGFAAVSIWASWSVITRLAVTTGLDASDIVALRFGVAGLLLSPVLLQRGLARDRLGWLGLAVIISGAGAPYALVAAVGLRFAPAYDGGALNPGCMPLFVAVISALVLGEKHSTARKLGLSLILAGVLIIVGCLVARHLTLGHSPEGLITTLARALLREDAGFHAYQMLEAGVQQFREWGNGDQGRHILIAVARYLAAHWPTQRALWQTADIAQRLMGGGELHRSAQAAE
jgi:EamA-like transporter family protein